MYRRKQLLPASDAEVEVPLNLDEAVSSTTLSAWNSLILIEGSHANYADRARQKVRANNIQVMILNVSFHQIANRIYNRVISTPPLSPEKAIELDEELQHRHVREPSRFESNLTASDYPWLRFPAHRLFWRYSNLRIIIHQRAFLEYAVNGIDPIGKGSSHTGRSPARRIGPLSTGNEQPALPTIGQQEHSINPLVHTASTR